MATKYDNIINYAIDKHAPIITKTFMIKQYSPSIANLNNYKKIGVPNSIKQDIIMIACIVFR